MAITPRSSIDPNAMADAWATSVGQSGAKWLKGIRSPRRLPNANPAQNAANWQAGVSAALPAFTAGISDPNYLTSLENGAQAKQASFSGAGQARKANAQKGFARVAPMIQSALSGLGPRGPKGTNSARGAAFGEAMHAQKGK